MSREMKLIIANLLVLTCFMTSMAKDHRGTQFIGFSEFKGFQQTVGESAQETVLTSAVLEAAIEWNELVASWNVEMPAGGYMKTEARAFHGERPTKYFVMGLWSSDPAAKPRESVKNQKDEDGDVATDTLKLASPARRYQVRLTLGGFKGEQPRLKFLGLTLMDSRIVPEPLSPNRKAWGKVLPVPERSQMAYPNGGVLCSPTTISMMMAFWSQRLHRPELDHDVPEIEREVFDRNWNGTGNWAFNTAWAGAQKGMRAYVSRFSDVAELEDWIARGIPVGLSICYDRLRGKSGGPSGHLVLCVGFTENGDVILNDPGTRLNVRKVFPRKSLAYAWAYSRNAVYLVYPEGTRIPKDRFDHWD